MKKLEDFKDEEIKFVSFRNGKRCVFMGGISFERVMEILNVSYADDMFVGIATINDGKVNHLSPYLESLEARAIANLPKKADWEYTNGSYCLFLDGLVQIKCELKCDPDCPRGWKAVVLNSKWKITVVGAKTFELEQSYDSFEEAQAGAIAYVKTWIASITPYL